MSVTTFLGSSCDTFDAIDVYGGKGVGCRCFLLLLLGRLEYKKHREATSNVQGRNQMAASSALYQCNRYKLRKRTRNQDNRPRTSEGSQFIRHDGMTIVAQFYEI